MDRGFVTAAAHSGGLTHVAEAGPAAPIRAAGFPAPPSVCRRRRTRRDAELPREGDGGGAARRPRSLDPSGRIQAVAAPRLTAVLLKVSLEVVVRIKGRLITRFRSASTPTGKAVATLALWVVAAGSKFVVLELVDLVFGGAVSLGGFVPVTLLVVTLLLARASVRALLQDPARGPVHIQRDAALRP